MKDKDTQKNKEFYYDLFLLKNIYSKISEVIETYRGEFLTIKNEQLNAFYVVLTNRAEIILKKDGLDKLREMAPNNLPNSLMIDEEELDVAYEFYVRDIKNFLGTLEKELVLSGFIFTLTDDDEKYFDIVDVGIKKHKKLHDEAWSFYTDKTKKDKPVFVVSKKDRAIKINEFTIKEPYSDSQPMTLFEYILENPEKLIKREEMQQGMAYAIRGVSFNKLIGELGFEGCLLKAFFPIRRRDLLLFRKEVSEKELSESGTSKKELLEYLKKPKSNPK